MRNKTHNQAIKSELRYVGLLQALGFMCDRLKNPQGTLMKAVICTKYGSPEVLQIRQVDKPIPKKNEALIKIYATTVHIGDTKIRSFKPGMGFFLDLLVKPMMRIMIGFRGPRRKILGMELAGEIETVGENVTYDIVFDAVGKLNYSDCKQSLKKMVFILTC